MMKDSTITVICPLYNAEQYILKLHQSVLRQRNVKISEIKYIVTESDDRTEEILKENDITYELIQKKAFSHSLVREKAALNCSTDIIVFITQDILIEKEDWLYELIRPLVDGEAEASFSRQLCDNNSIEKYTREKNYPNISRVVSKTDVDKMGLNTFFFSDAASAIIRSIFVELKGYDGKNLPISEDMYIAYKLIEKGYRIKYCADSEVVHSHDFTLKQQYERYRLTGVFFKQNSYLDQFGTNKAGGNLAVYILKRAFRDRNWRVIIDFIPNMAARFLGMKVGRYFG